jgi:pimeloyl-ACP methyl ester carboxylesterase
VAAVLAAAAGEVDPGTRRTTTAAAIPFSSLGWGIPSDRPLVLVHGVTSSARIWWRVGPALAAAGRHVIAVDLPGHGLTGHWVGHHGFRDNAADVAAWIRAIGLDRDDLQVVGHSWGGMTVAALPVGGIRPATLVLLDPPAVPHDYLVQMVSFATERRQPDLETALSIVAAAEPGWSAGDALAKAEALTQFDEAAVLAIMLDNGDWDGGLADISDPAAAGIDRWLIRGDPATGSLLPDAAVPGFATLMGADHVITIAGAPHSPQRTHPVETTAALLRALGPA